MRCARKFRRTPRMAYIRGCYRAVKQRVGHDDRVPAVYIYYLCRHKALG